MIRKRYWIELKEVWIYQLPKSSLKYSPFPLSDKLQVLDFQTDM